MYSNSRTNTCTHSNAHARAHTHNRTPPTQTLARSRSRPRLRFRSLSHLLSSFSLSLFSLALSLLLSRLAILFLSHSCLFFIDVASISLSRTQFLTHELNYLLSHTHIEKYTLTCACMKTNDKRSFIHFLGTWRSFQETHTHTHTYTHTRTQGRTDHPTMSSMHTLPWRT